MPLLKSKLLTWRSNLEGGKKTAFQIKLVNLFNRGAFLRTAFAEILNFQRACESVCGVGGLKSAPNAKLTRSNSQLLTFLQSAAGGRHCPGCAGAAFKTRLHRWTGRTTARSFATETPQRARPPRRVRTPLLHLPPPLGCLLLPTAPCKHTREFSNQRQVLK